MHIDLTPLAFTFSCKPLLIGGKAMEYYGLREAGADIDFVVTREDRARLAAQYPEHVKDLFGDLGVCKDGFEVWQTICLFDYAYLSRDAVDAGEFLVISIEKLILLKTLAMHIEKYHRDLELLKQYVLGQQYAPPGGSAAP
jgi:hypothetical protein